MLEEKKYARDITDLINQSDIETSFVPNVILSDIAGKIVSAMHLWGDICVAGNEEGEQWTFSAKFKEYETSGCKFQRICSVDNIVRVSDVVDSPSFETVVEIAALASAISYPLKFPVLAAVYAAKNDQNERIKMCRSLAGKDINPITKLCRVLGGDPATVAARKYGKQLMDACVSDAHRFLLCTSFGLDNGEEFVVGHIGDSILCYDKHGCMRHRYRKTGDPFSW